MMHVKSIELKAFKLSYLFYVSETPRKRAQSAPPAKVGRDLWMNAVKKRQTQNLTRSRPESPRHKTSTEYWVDTLRKTGIGTYNSC